MKLRRSLCRFLTIASLSCTLLLGCAASDDAARAERREQARTALQAKRYHEVLTLLQETPDDPKQLPDEESAQEYSLMEGLASVKLGNYRRAVDALENVQPRSLELRIYIAYLHLLLGDAQRARSIAAALELHYGQRPAISILLGNISLKEQIYHEAEQHFRTASLLDPSSAKAYIGLANTFLLQRYFIKAEANYLKAVLLSKNDPSGYIALLNYYIATGRYEDGIYTSEIALKRYPKNINLLLVQYHLYASMGRNSDGITILERSLEKFPHSIDLKVRLTHSYYKAGRLDDAFHLIERLLIDDQESYYGLLLMGEYYLRKHDLDMAFFNFNKALLINNNSYLINYYIGLIYAMKDKMKFAIQFLEKSIQNHPGFEKSHLLLSFIYMHQHKYDLASGHAKVVLQLDPSNIQAHLINGFSLYLQNYFIESKYEFDVVYTLDHKDPIANIIQTLIEIETNDFSKTEFSISTIDDSHIEKSILQFHIHRILNKKPLVNIEAYFQRYMDSYPSYLAFIVLAQFYKEHKDLEKAKAYLMKAKDANGTIVIPYYELAELEAMQGNHTTAIAYLQQVIELQPSFVKAYVALGSLYEQIKDYSRAKIIYETGLRYMPEHSVLLNNLAWINLVHFGDRAAAYVGIRRALNLSPEDPDIQDSLAWWYYLNDNHEHALALLRTLVATRPLNPLYHYHLGMVYLKLGEQQAARHYLHKSMELGIDDGYRRAIADLLQ